MLPQTLKQVKTTLSQSHFKIEFKPHDLYPLLVIAPVVIFYFIDPKMFEIDWVGSATFAYAGFFVIITWLINRRITKPSNKIHLKGTTLSTAAIFLYQFLVYNVGFSETIVKLGTLLGIHEVWLYSWLISVDITFFALYLTALTISFFGLKSLKKFFAPIVYLFLTVSAILINAYQPRASFTALQIFVPYIMFTVGNLLPIFGVNAQTYSINDQTGQIRSIMIVNKPRFLAFEIAWPCAGISSILIYFALMYGLLQIWDTTKNRKAIYLTVGLIGTILVNILRIVALILFYSYFNANLSIFHEYVGALFFVAWITIFLFIVFLIEKKNLSSTHIDSA